TSSSVTASTALVDYIRDVANLKGTKVMCREGGCGACTVVAKVVDPATQHTVIKSVNACLTPVLSCDGWDISTIESLGNKHEGYHVIQNRIVNFHGTQCGYCTPGMLMNMHGLLGAKNDLQMEDIEKNLDGNICRCTGYRFICRSKLKIPSGSLETGRLTS
ncbi:Xanthine dehydrogenase, partial [Orchesella cincta]